MFDNYILEENATSLFEYEITPKKIESQLINFITYGLETHKTDRARPFCFSFYRLSKLAAEYNRDLTQEETDSCKKDTTVFYRDKCLSNALAFVLKFKGGERNLQIRIVESNLNIRAQNGSEFVTWIVLNILPCNKRNFDINEKGKVFLN